MKENEEKVTITLGVNSPQKLPSDGWTKADWLVTVGTILEEGEFTGVHGKTINWTLPVIQQIMQTAVNKDINIYHPNRPLERKTKVGRIYAQKIENGKGKIKYVTWDKDANIGIESGHYKLSLEADVIGTKNEKGPDHYDAVSGEISVVALVEDPAVAGATNEGTQAVALEKQRIDQAADAEPGIRFPRSAQLTEKELSPCISLLQKQGYTLTKGTVTNVSQEISEGEGAPDTPPADPTPPAKPTPAPPVVEETPEQVSMEEFKAMQAKMEAMAEILENQSEQIATLEGTDLKTVKEKILHEAPKTDFKTLPFLAGVEDQDEKKRILSAHLAGLLSRDTPAVDISGVDEENQAEKPDAVEMEDMLYEKHIGIKDPFKERKQE